MLTPMAEALKAKIAGGISDATWTERACERANQESSGSLPDFLRKDVDCTICGNKGYTLTVADGILRARECECMKRRRSISRLRKSGLASLAQEYTFDRYQEIKPWQRAAKQKALSFLNEPIGHWFYIAGTPGSGKTHLCTAVATAMIDGGREVIYMLWRDAAPRLKSLVNDREQYEKEIDRYKRIDVLYIDDFFKGSVSDGDKNLAFELLNARYNNSRLITIISSERTAEDILSIDEAIGSRIYERSKGFYVRTASENWRLMGAEDRGLR